MIKLFETGAYLLNGTELIADDADAVNVLAGKGINVNKEEAAKNTMAYSILEKHNTSELVGGEPIQMLSIDKKSSLFLLLTKYY